MTKEEFTFLSQDKETKLHGILWKPQEGSVRGILQIAHGMAEYVERYEAFAEYLTDQGYLVAGHDHLGHGASVRDTSYWGYFAPEGSRILVEDMDTLRRRIQKEYPGVPYFILGHSMGSFLVRKYLYLHGEGLQGAILMGTGTQPDVTVKLGKRICSFMAKFRGWRYRSSLVQKLSFAQNEKPYAKEHRKNSWLSRDEEVVRIYNEEPRCGFTFTLNGFYTLFDTIWDINRPEHMAKTPKDLPLLLVSGDEDPVGDFGAGVKRVYGIYQSLGMEDLTMKLYPQDRHEILNEPDKDKVYGDIYHWMEARHREAP